MVASDRFQEIIVSDCLFRKIPFLNVVDSFCLISTHAKSRIEVYHYGFYNTC